MMPLKTLSDKDPEAYKKLLSILEDGHFSWNGRPGCQSYIPSTNDESFEGRLRCQSPIPTNKTNKRKLVPMIRVKPNGETRACLCESDEKSNKKVCE